MSATLSPEEIHITGIAAGLARVEQALRAHLLRVGGEGALEQLPPIGPAPDEFGPLEHASALDVAAGVFGLTPFERDLLVLCAGVELDARFPELCAAAQGNPQLTSPTFSLALAALEGSDWQALTPQAPLRRWKLIEVGAGSHLTQSPLRIDERVLHYLMGLDQLDSRLGSLLEPVIPGELVPSQETLVAEICAVWNQLLNPADYPAVLLCGPDAHTQRAVAAAACTQAGLLLYAWPVEALPPGFQELDDLVHLWNREALLAGAALLVECGEVETSGTPRAEALSRLLERVPGPLFISSRDRRPTRKRALVTFDVGGPTQDEQRGLWRSTLAEPGLNGHVDRLAAQFDVDVATLRDCALQAVARAGSAAPGEAPETYANRLEGVLWEACRARTRPKLDGLAQHITSPASWDDLVLPEIQKSVLRDMAAHVRQRHTVYQEWGFAGRGSRGLGISAMFAGDSGTGKTMAAEVLANELRLDLYRVDLSAAVSKYIGETEKNLRKIFDAAEGGGVILLFDEADALFGKRSDVKDSHDRFANVQVSYLLQRMECYRGLAILTTNLRSALDTAFLRRIRFIVQFPFPDAAQRAEIWKRAFPAGTPTDSLDPEKLARLNVAGGNIRNVALNAAFLAADAGEPVRMTHLLRAARAEYSKLEKNLTDAEAAGWV